MPVKLKLLPKFRLLNASLPVAHLSLMKSNHSSKVINVSPVFSRVFPHKLKYHCQSFRFPNLPSRQQSQNVRTLFGVRTFSNASARERTGSVAASEARASKSLIDDEAELSDWVSGLSSNSFRKNRPLSDSEGDNDGGGRNSGFNRDRNNNRGRGREDRSGKRSREVEFDEFDTSRRRSGGYNPVESFPRRKGRFDGELKAQGDQRPMSRSRDRLSGDNEFGRRKGGGSNGRYSGGVRDSSDKFLESSRDSNDKFSRGSSHGRESEGRRGKKNGFKIEHKRSNAFEYGRYARGKGMSQGTALLSDEGDDVLAEEEEKGYVSFKELIDSEESSDEIDSQDDEDRDPSSCNDTSPSSSPGRTDSYLTETRFDQYSVSPMSLKALKDAGYEKMTVVQEATLPVILKGKDVLAKAKTGTGKTVAFLLPSIEVVVKSPPIDRDQKRPPILVLVICPTRELASQAATEANTLLKFHPSVGVQVVIGGTRLALEQKRMQANPCQILVATPGRLRDHIENTAGFATRLMGVKVLVLDEADHLLDMGFRKDIEKIIAAIPKQRQTLLFSATIPQEVRHICHVALKRDHEFINTVQEGGEETHSQVRQMHLVAPVDNHFTLLYTVLKEHIADDVDYKVLVFCTTAMVTRLVAGLLGELNLNVREIHSRKPQSYRTRISDEFRKSKGLILVTSDVSARGVDYPDVTLVVQIGLPSDRQQYIHRLGRTGRKGKEGQGILLLAPWEEFFLSTIKDLPVSKAEVPLIDPDSRKKVERAMSHVEMKTKEAAYQAWLGYYNSNKTVGKDKYRLVELANDFSRSMGLDNPPAIPKLVLGKMGLRNIPGLRTK